MSDPRQTANLEISADHEADPGIGRPEGRRRLYIIDSGTNVMAFDFETDGTDPEYRGKVLWPALVKEDLDDLVRREVVSSEAFHPADQVCQLKDPSVVHPFWGRVPLLDFEAESQGSTQHQETQVSYPGTLLFVTATTTDIQATADPDGTIHTAGGELLPDWLLDNLDYTTDSTVRQQRPMSLADLMEVLPNADGTGPADEFSCLRFCTSYWDENIGQYVLNLEGVDPSDENVDVSCFREFVTGSNFDGNTGVPLYDAIFWSENRRALYDSTTWLSVWNESHSGPDNLIRALSSACRTSCTRRSIVIAGGTQW